MDDFDQRVHRKGIFCDDKLAARKLWYQSAHYCLIDNVLYQRGYTLPYLRCVSPEEGNYIFQEIHEGICGNYLDTKALALKTLHQGYHWPTLRRDADHISHTCHNCQIYADIPQKPPEPLIVLTSPWPFVQWGLKLINLLSTGRGQAEYAIIAIEYFTKWIDPSPWPQYWRKRQLILSSVIFFVVTAYIELLLLTMENNSIILILEIFVSISTSTFNLLHRTSKN